jgi:hypothetical protein
MDFTTSIFMWSTNLVCHKHIVCFFIRLIFIGFWASENEYFRGHIFIYSGSLKDDNLKRTLPAHLAILLATDILGHHEENICARLQMGLNVIAGLFLLPVVVVHPFTGLFILPYLVGFGVEFVTEPTKVYLEEEADDVALRLVDRAGFDVADTVYYWATSLDRNAAAYNAIVGSHGGKQNIPPRVGLYNIMLL